MLHLLLILAALTAPPPPGSVALSAPRPFEVWDGRVTGRVPAGTAAVLVEAGGRRWRVAVRKDGRFDRVVSRVPLGAGEVRVAGRLVTPVWGLPSGSVAALAPADDDADLDRRFAGLARRATASVGIYSHAWDGRAAAYNAGAEFEAASTLKLPLMLAAMAETGEALPTSEYWELMTRITRYSDNEAANELLEMVGGSEEGGAARMLELLHSLGLSHTFMAGGYLTGFGGGPPVVTVVDPPPSAYKYTTPAEMARVAGYLVSAAAGRGPLLRHGITPHEARQLLYLMVQAADAGLVPAGANGLPVAHKIGWLERTNNDIAIVFTYRGPVVIAIYTFGPQDGSAVDFGVAATRAALAR